MLKQPFSSRLIFFIGVNFLITVLSTVSVNASVKDELSIRTKSTLETTNMALNITKHLFENGLQLECKKPNSQLKYSFQWEKPLGVVIAQGSKLNTDDKGIYYCRAGVLIEGKWTEEIAFIETGVATAKRQMSSSAVNFQVHVEFTKPNILRCYTIPLIADALFEWHVNGEIRSNEPVFVVNDLHRVDSHKCVVRVWNSIDRQWKITNNSVSPQVEKESYLQISGGYATISTGSQFLLNCEIEDTLSTGYDVNWFFNRQPLNPVLLTRLNIERRDTSRLSQLVLRNVQRVNEGYYQCQVKNGVVKSLSVNINNLPGVATVEIMPSEQEIKEGTSVEFICKARRQSESSVGLLQWMYLGNELEGAQIPLHTGWIIRQFSASTYEYSSRIRLDKVNLADAGYYSCATKQGERSVVQLKVRRGNGVQNEIKVTVNTKEVKIHPNEVSTVECTVKTSGQLFGQPMWRFTNASHSIERDSRFQILQIREGVSQLRIRNMVTSDSVRRIECYYGEHVDWFELEVIRVCDSRFNFLCSNGRCVSRDSMCNKLNDCGDTSDENPNFCPNTSRTIKVTISPQEIRVRPGSAGTIECNTFLNGEYHGTPQWKFENQQYPIEMIDRRFTVTRRSTGHAILSFRNLRESENGLRVECSLENEKKIAVIYVESSCGFNEFRCRNGQCIPRDRQCDDRRDCLDNSDEDSCSTPSQTCDPLELKCEVNNRGEPPSKLVFSPSWKCDGENDCGNNFDETDCGANQCTGRLFECSDNGPSIPRAYMCDKENDCPGGQDENDCRMIQIQQTTGRIHRVSRGNTIYLSCKAIGRPIPTVIWRFNWNCLPDPSRMTVSNQVMPGCTEVESTLTIRNIQPGDDGIYNCEALTSRHRVLSDDYQVILLGRE